MVDAVFENETRIATQADIDSTNLSAPEPTPDDVRAEGERRIKRLVRDATGNTYSASEQATWSEQILEAEQIIANPAILPASVPLLSALATARGITLSEMALRVTTNRDAFKAITAAVLAAQTVIIDTIGGIPANFREDSFWP